MLSVHPSGIDIDEEQLKKLRQKNNYWDGIVQFLCDLKPDPVKTQRQRAFIEEFKDCGNLYEMQLSREQLTHQKRINFSRVIQELKSKRDALVRKVGEYDVNKHKQIALYNHISNEANELCTQIIKRTQNLPVITSIGYDKGDYLSFCTIVRDKTTIESLFDKIGVNGILKCANFLIQEMLDECNVLDVKEEGLSLVKKFEGKHERQPVPLQKAILMKLKGQVSNIGYAPSDQLFPKASYVSAKRQFDSLVRDCANLSGRISSPTRLSEEHKRTVGRMSKSFAEYNDRVKSLLTRVSTFTFQSSVPCSPIHIEAVANKKHLISALKAYIASHSSITMNTVEDLRLELELSDKLNVLVRDGQQLREYLECLQELQKFPLHRL